MKVSVYEKTYRSVHEAERNTRNLDEVVEFLRKQNEPVTCAIIGKGVFGEAYTNWRSKNTLSARLGQMLKHLRQGGFIKLEERKGDPIEVEEEGWIPDLDINGETATITVHDDKGREYVINNPNFVGSYRHGHWGRVKKTITPIIKYYTWIGD